MTWMIAWNLIVDFYFYTVEVILKMLKLYFIFWCSVTYTMWNCPCTAGRGGQGPGKAERQCEGAGGVCGAKPHASAGHGGPEWDPAPPHRPETLQTLGAQHLGAPRPASRTGQLHEHIIAITPKNLFRTVLNDLSILSDLLAFISIFLSFFLQVS